MPPLSAEASTASMATVAMGAESDLMMCGRLSSCQMKHFMADLICASQVEANAIQGVQFLGIFRILILVSLHVSAKTHSTVLEVRNLASLEHSVGAATSRHASFRREVVEFLGTFFGKNLNHKPRQGFVQKVVEHGLTMLFEHMIAALNFWNMLMRARTASSHGSALPFWWDPLWA